jgi:hypothetical protein
MSHEIKRPIPSKRNENRAGDETLCGDSVQELVQNLEAQDREALARFSREFCRNQLSVVQAKIDAHARYVDRHYAPGLELPEEEQVLMEIYRVEKALLQELGQNGEDRLFVEAGCQRLEQTMKRLAQLQERESSTLRRQEFTRAWVEMDILLRLVEEWHKAIQELLGRAA